MVSAVANAPRRRVKPCPISVPRDSYRRCYRTLGDNPKRPSPQRYQHGSVSRTLVPPRAREITSTSASPRMSVKPMPRPREHDSAPKPTPSSTMSIVRRPSVTRPQPRSSTRFGGVRVSGVRVNHRVRARLGEDEGKVIGKLCEQHPRHSLRTTGEPSSAAFHPPPASPETAREALLPS